MRVDVVIPTWNGRDLLLDCLEHLERDPWPHRAIVVDDASADGTAEVVRSRFPHVLVVERERNGGFVAAVNTGFKTAESAVVVLLNNDANVQPGFLERMVEPFAKESVGMVAGVLVNPANGLIDAAGVEVDGGLAGYSFMHGRSLDELRDAPRGLLGPCGGAAAYRLAAVRASGGLDGELWAYSEDVELALRLQAAGWSCALAADARADHVGSATFGARSASQLATAARSRGYVCGRYRVGLGWLTTELLVTCVNCCLARSPKPLSALFDGWKRGARLERRHRPNEVPKLTWRAAARRRLAAIR